MRHHALILPCAIYKEDFALRNPRKEFVAKAKNGISCVVENSVLAVFQRQASQVS